MSALEAVKKKFQAWRQDPSRPHRIPERLWQDAVSLVGTGLSLNQISRSLNIDFSQLKRLSLTEKSTSDGLVEIHLPETLSAPSIVPLAEIISQNGVVLRLFSQDSSSIIKAFLES
ncbi:MAG: hypothetical protein HQM09_19765 [Candidatus Riflebacteria bacterium]|nr:hypothetical protein [Candidatus Riflebacteria bacterium]